jgi:caspase domain-containing protein/Sel1 repeat-containing protein
MLSPSRGPQRPVVRGTAVLGLLALVAALVPVTPPGAAIAQVAPHPGKTDEFLVVDCLLPGQVRRLGQKLTILTARRAMKTSQRDCEIRGGEYVAYDRANYATALKVWLPLAEGGDAAAQTYVGEIHEKGLGVPPDHAVAARWYRRAADAGYPRAAINLGHLYERGLGVPLDAAMAVSLYRRAAGQTPVDFQVSPADNTAEVQKLRTEITDLRQQLDARQQTLDRTQADLDSARRQLDQRRSEVDGDREQLAKLRRALDESRATERAATAGLRELERTVADREGKAALRERELRERARADAERQRADSEKQRADADKQRAEAERERAELARLRKDLDESRAKERTAAASLRDLERAVTEREAQIGAKEREIASLRTTVGRTEADATARRATAEREVADLRASLAKLEAEAKTQREASRPAPAPKPAAEVAPVIELIEPELVATRDAGIQAAHLAASTTKAVVVGRVRSAGGLKSLTVNGREEPVDAQELFKAQVTIRNPEERVRIVAVDKGGRRSTLDFLLIDPGARRTGGGDDDRAKIGYAKNAGATNFGNYHALVIGIDNYRQLPPLKTAVTDAQEIARILGREYGFKTTVLVNATRYEILSALNTLRERLTDKDNLVIYYAGHGQLDQINQRGHWLPADAEPESSANWISNIAITDVLNAMTVRQLLVISDSCYSGALTRSAVGRLDGGLSEQHLAQVMVAMAQKRSRMVLTSGGLEPVLDGGGGAHSVFAKTLLDVLRSNQGVLPGQELFRHLRLRVAAQADRAQVSQVPEYAPIKYAGHEAGDFFFVRATN